MASNTMASRLFTGSPDHDHDDDELRAVHPSDEQPPTREPHSASKICRVCGDEIGHKENGDQLFVACHVCAFPVSRPCYEYERSEDNQCCPQCNTRYKRHKGSARVAGDEEDNDDLDDFDDEFEMKNQQDHQSEQQHFANPSENGDQNNQQRNVNGQAFSYAGSVAGKDFDPKKMPTAAQNGKRVEKWKVKQEKKGLVSKDTGNNDQDDEHDYM